MNKKIFSILLLLVVLAILTDQTEEKESKKVLARSDDYEFDEGEFSGFDEELDNAEDEFDEDGVLDYEDEDESGDSGRPTTKQAKNKECKGKKHHHHKKHKKHHKDCSKYEDEKKVSLCWVKD